MATADPFEFESYRAFLAHLCDNEKARGFRASLARAAACQASYFSQALRGRAHLTEDHLAGIAMHLNFGAAETEFLLLLQRREKAGTEKLRAHLTGAIQETRKARQNLKNRVRARELRSDERDLATYSASWIPSAVHLLTSDPAHQSVDAVARRLKLSRAKAEATLLFLEKAGFVERTGRGWSYRAGSLHISRDSPWHTTLQNTRRELASRAAALGNDGTHFSSIFTVDPEDLKKLRELVAKMIADSHDRIAKSGTKRLACLCVDLFEVI